MSKGEKKIENILKSNKIKFQKEYEFPKLKNRLPLRFDFAVFDEDYEILCLIEFDGEQHFKVVSHWGGEQGLKKRKVLDWRKNQYCLTHEIVLIRIPYWDFDRINEKTLFTTEDWLVKTRIHYNYWDD